MRSFLIPALVFGLISSAYAGPREIAVQAFPSVVMLVTEDSRGQPLAIGSGFFVKENVIASNAHVIEGAAGGYAKLVGQKAKFNIKGIVAIDSRHDLVLLGVQDTAAPTLELGDSARAVVGDRVYSLGNPSGLEGTFAEGIISGIRDIEGDKLLQITAPISPGSSGGPILDESGSVVGVAVATYKGGQNLNFAIPIAEVTNLITKIHAPVGLATRRPEDKQKSYVTGLGEDNTNGVELANIEWSDFQSSNSKAEQPIYFVIRNRLQQPVAKVVGVLIFYDRGKEPVGYKYFHYDETTILPGLAKPAHTTVAQKTYKFSQGGSIGFRILSFQIVDGVNE